MNRFVDFLPPVYKRLYDPQEVTEHAAIAARRGNRLVHAETWNSKQGQRLCVVAVDRPGLLSLVTDALLAQGMAIRSARAFCREVGNGEDEVVDFLELRELDGPDETAAELDEGGLEAFAQHLSDLVADTPPTDTQSEQVPADRPPTRVYFERESLAEGRYLLVIEAPDSNGLLHAVSSTLDEKAMRILACQIQTLNGRVSNRFELTSSSGKILSDSALCDVQLAVLDALPSRARASRPPSATRR
jgi:UTP:GlnB (protein PII) uridylyltransferase